MSPAEVAAGPCRRAALAGGLALAAALGGCAAMNSLQSEVTSYSKWPEARKPATYVFERLPSQQQRPQQQQVLEDAARPAIEAAGFRPAAPGAPGDVSIQLGARVTGYERSAFDDPLWYGAYGGRGYYRPWIYSGRFGRPAWGPFWGPWGWPYSAMDTPYYEREVAVLIRDKQTGEPLYETRAQSDGTWSDIGRLLPAMYAAALKDFPKAVNTSHRIPLDTAAAAAAR